jgi:ABC-type sugar transport system permease subunit
MSTAAAPGSVVERPPRRRLPSFKGGGWQALPFLAPTLVLVGAFLILPVIWTIAMSFNTGAGLRFRRWVGFDNYERLLTRDSRFLDTESFPWSGALINNVKWLIIYPLMLRPRWWRTSARGA